MIKNNFKYIIAFFIFLIICISCSKNNKSSVNNTSVSKNIDTIISLSPAITEILIDLKIADRIIASDFYSKKILTKYNIKTEDIVTFDLVSPDAEKIIYLKPDIVLLNSLSLFSGEEALKNINDMGIYTVVIPYSETISDIEKDILYISSIFNKNKEGIELTDKMNADIEKIKAISATITNKKRVYFEIGFSPSFYSFGTNVFLNEMIEIIGAENIFKDRNSWINVSEESIIYKNPDIIFTSVDYIENPEDEILNRKAWQNINAVKNKNVYFIDTDSSTLANHNIIKAMFQMAKSVYSNEYSNF